MATFEFFDIFPKILRAGHPAKITVASRFPNCRFVEELRAGGVRLRWISGEGLLPSGDVPDRWGVWNELAFTVENADAGIVSFEFTPEGEGEYAFELRRKKEVGYGDVFCEFGLYALDQDLFRLRPWRGDFHVHSNSSECGSALDDPKFVTATARLKGLDFMALTDHMQQEPSRAVAAYWREAGAGLQVFPGEEVHVLKNPVPTRYRKNEFYSPIHIVSVGADDGIVKFQNDRFAEFDADVTARADKLGASIPPVLRRMMAASDWIFDKIHEFHGFGIFCHPFWKPLGRYNLPAPVRDYMLAQRKFDAVEVFGLVTDAHRSALRDGNQMAQAWWQEACVARGGMIPVVGTTDSHLSSVMLGRQYTIVWSADCGVESVCNAIRAGRSVAVMDHPEENLQICGSLRLMKYTQFLIREFYPEQQALCELDGRSMLASLRGGSYDAGLAGGVEKLMKHLWA